MDRKTAVISSTSIDLPEHRQRVKDACIAAAVFPEMMESLPARDQDAIAASMDLVDRADVYIGIYAYRYGYVPKGEKVSITEMELDRALERAAKSKVVILPFIMDATHQVVEGMIESNASARRKLERLKQRACGGRLRKLFTSAQDLYGQVLGALQDLRLQELQAKLVEAEATVAQLKESEQQAQAEVLEVKRSLQAAQAKLAAGDTNPAPLPRGEPPPVLRT